MPRPSAAAHAAAMPRRERRRSASTTARRASRSKAAIQRTAAARGRWCSTWLAVTTSTERAANGRAPPSATTAASGAGGGGGGGGGGCVVRQPRRGAVEVHPDETQGDPMPAGRRRRGARDVAQARTDIEQRPRGPRAPRAPRAARRRGAEVRLEGAHDGARSPEPGVEPRDVVQLRLYGARVGAWVVEQLGADHPPARPA